MEHTPTRGDTIVIDGTPQTLECVVHRFDVHDELVAALTGLLHAFPGDYTVPPAHITVARAALAKVQS